MNFIKIKNFCVTVNGVGTPGQSPGTKKEWCIQTSHCTLTINSKYIKNLNIKNIKILEENKGLLFYDSFNGKGFLTVIENSEAIREKIDKFIYIKNFFKILCIRKNKS